MITSSQSEKYFQNDKMKEKTNVLWPCVGDTSECKLLLLFEVPYFSRFLFLFIYNFIQTQQILNSTSYIL